MIKGKRGPVDTTNSPDKLNRIVEGAEIVGDVKTDSNFRMDGRLTGKLDTTGKLVIGVSGRIEGDVKCSNADIEGEFEGNIQVDGLLYLKSTAKLTGTIKTSKLKMEDGAEFNGKCDMGAVTGTAYIPENTLTVDEAEPEVVY